MQLCGFSQALSDQVKIVLGCGDAALRLLLKGVQYVDRFGKSNGLDCAPCAAPLNRNDLQH
jgi:hypothetical protein